MKYGFIGLGNMASAIIRGLVKSGVPAAEIYGHSARAVTGESLSAATGLRACASNAEVVNACDVIILAVKPQVLPQVLDEIKSLPLGGKLFISIAAGLDLAFLQKRLGNVPIVRVMPNINARIGAATSGLCFSPQTSPAQVETARKIFECVGSVSEIPERYFSVFTAIAGSSPAFTYIYVDALARAGLRYGLTKKQALEAAASSVLGSARLILESAEHPFALADQVCSPDGATIEGVAALQAGAFESAVHQAVEAVILKDKALAK